jgi:hypothetical protein
VEVYRDWNAAAAALHSSKPTSQTSPHYTYTASKKKQTQTAST